MLVRAPCEMYWEMNFAPKIPGTKNVSNLILAVEVRCHKVQGMTETFTDTLYSRAKTSSSVHQKAGFTAFLERDSRYA